MLAMIRGRYRWFFWLGTLALVVGAFTPAIGGWGAAIGLLGLLSYEHSFVQAGQSVPLA
jgi:hypothetical protein